MSLSDSSLPSLSYSSSGTSASPSSPSTPSIQPSTNDPELVEGLADSSPSPFWKSESAATTYNNLQNIRTTRSTSHNTTTQSLRRVSSLPITKLQQHIKTFLVVSPKPAISLSLPSTKLRACPPIPLSNTPSTRTRTKNHDLTETSEKKSQHSKRITFSTPSISRPALRPTRPSSKLELPVSPASTPVDISKASARGTPAKSRLRSFKILASYLPSTVSESGPSPGALDAYPLRYPSALCKAMGGGRWVPKPLPYSESYTPPLPGFKAQWELDLEEEERREFERKYRPNPIIIDGPFRMRVPKEYEPEPNMFLSRSPCRIEATY